MSVESDLGDEQYCYLTTTGRSSGLPREIEIWFGARGNTIYLLSGGGQNAHWVMNIMRDPRVSVRIGDESFTGTARLVGAGSEEEATARRLLPAKYEGWRPDLPLSSWGR